MSRWISPEALRRRIDELDALRLERPLTSEERTEADVLTHRLYMRSWRDIHQSTPSRRSKACR